MITVVLADDEVLMRAGIRLILDNAEDIEVVAEAADGPTAVRACRDQKADVALLDVQMPGGDGISAVAHLTRTVPHTRSIVLTAFGEDHNVAEALRAGAQGFLLKDTEPAELIRAVRHTSTGEPILSPQITRRLIERHLMSAQDTDPARRRVTALTENETDVLRLVGVGESNAEIARHLHMAVGTVKAHLSRVLAKLDCSNRVQAAILAHEAGLLAD